MVPTSSCRPSDCLIGGVNFSDLKITLKEAVVEGGAEVTPAVTLNYGNFIQTTLDFIIIALAIFLLVKGMNALNKKKKEEPKAPAAPPADIQLLTEIRDLLKKREIKKTVRLPSRANGRFPLMRNNSIRKHRLYFPSFLRFLAKRLQISSY